MAAKNQDLRTVTPKEAVGLIERCMVSGTDGRALMLWGPPGIGKSDIFMQIAQKQKRPLIDLRLLLMEPTDLKGIPYYDPVGNTMRWAKPSELPPSDDTENPLSRALLFLDEINAAPPSVQAAAYQLILNRRIGEYRLPAGVRIAAAGNRESDRGVTYRMPKPLANRFVHLAMLPNFENWQEWAVDKRIDPDVVGFLTATPRHLFNFDPKAPDHAFATPRSWMFVSDLLYGDGKGGRLSDVEVSVLTEGCVGAGIATEFMQFRKFAAKLPNPKDIIEGRVKELKVSETSAHYSLAVNLCYVLQEAAQKVGKEGGISKDDFHKYFDNFSEFILTHFSKEMGILSARIAMKQYKLPVDHKKLKTFKRMFDTYGSYVMDTSL